MSHTLAPVEICLQNVFVAPGIIYHAILILADGSETILRVSSETGEALHRSSGKRYLFQPFVG